MKIAKNLFRFSTALKFHPKTFGIFRQKKIGLALLTGTIFSTAYLFGSQKIWKDQMQIFETQDTLKEGQMKELKVGPKQQDTVLLVKYQGKIYCTQSKCSHFGFSLVKGSFVGDKVICPLHNAGFSIKTGKPDQGPIFNGLKTFPVQVQNGKIKVSIPKTGWQSPPQPYQMDLSKLDKNKQIVIVGAGTAALSAVDTLRQSGYNGVIYMITKQKYSTYDRTLLSKVMDSVKKPGQFRSKSYYQNNGIVLLPQTTVTSVDYKNKKVNVHGKASIGYDKLLIATGCVNRYPDIKGLNQVKFNSLRNIQDYQNVNIAIRQQGAKNITIVGGGFIGIEVASSIKAALKDKVNVTVIEQGKTILEHVLGQQIGNVIKNLAQKNGIKIITSAKIKQITNVKSKPKQVILESENVPTDVLLLSTGVKCAVDFVPELVQKQNNGIKTNVYLETIKKDVFAAGDVATYPYWYTGKSIRIEHYNQAIYQGSVAALNMNGKKFPMDNIPFFWTRSFNNSLQVTGYTKGYDDIHIVGSLEEMKFIAYYLDARNNKVLGAASMGMLNSIQIVNEAMKNGVMPKASTIKSPQFKLQSLIPQIAAKNPKCTRCTHCSI